MRKLAISSKSKPSPAANLANAMFFLLALSIGILFQPAFAQQKTIAILPSDGGPLNQEQTEALTDRIHKAALSAAPASFTVLRQDVVIKRLGGAESYVKECMEGTCIVDMGKKAQADYVAKASVGKLEGRLRLKIDLYNVETEGSVDLFDEDCDDFSSMRKTIDENVPNMFKKIPGAFSGKLPSPAIPSGISGLSSAADYMIDVEKKYLLNLSTEPQRATPSFNGLPIASCSKTPCKAELPEGKVRIIAALEQYEIADTTISITRNNQSALIKLKPNFGVLEIKPAYLDGIGENEKWRLAISGKSYQLGEAKLLPGSYDVKIFHRCYEDIDFKVGINKGKREAFDLASHAKLKKGGLALSAERGGELEAEPVYVNGRRAGETPFSGAVPLCAEIEVGAGREKADVELRHNEKVSHTVRLESKEPAQEYEPYYSSGNMASASKSRASANWAAEYLFGLGVIMLMNTIDSLYASTGSIVSMGGEFYGKNSSFFRFGLNAGIGFLDLDEDAIKKIRPDTDSIELGTLLKAGVFAKLYPVDFLYLQGGVGFVRISYQFEGFDGIVDSKISTVEFPVGGGFILADIFYIEGLYHIVPSRSAGYLSIGGGMRFNANAW